jgi:Na+-translocating ferredoxin:NAD+ oxidoreductase RnfC subunit
MANLQCNCGKVLSDSHRTGELFREAQSECIGEMRVHDYFTQGEGREVLECLECGILCIENPSHSNIFAYYKPINEKYNEILSENN